MTNKTKTKPQHQDWLEKRYVEWRKDKIGRKGGMAEFAVYLGIDYDVFMSYINKGVKPAGKNLDLIGARLGTEIYDLVGAPKPNVLQLYVINNFTRLSEDVQLKIKEQMENYLAKQEDKDESEKSRQSHRRK